MTKKSTIDIWYHPEFNSGHPVMYYDDMKTVHWIDMENGGSKSFNPIVLLRIDLPEPMTKTQYDKFICGPSGAPWAEEAFRKAYEALKLSNMEHYSTLEVPL